MPPGMTVNLMGHTGTGLILEHPTGITYVNQAGGNYCLQRSCEGIFLPWFNDIEWDSPKLISPELALSDLPWEIASSKMTPADADGVDALLRAEPAFQGMRVDRDRLAESCEAWVHVVIEPPHRLGDAIYGAEPFPRTAVLVWTNSD